MTRVKGPRPFLELKPQTDSSRPSLVFCFLFIFYYECVCVSTTVHMHAEVRGQLVGSVLFFYRMGCRGLTRVLRLGTMAFLPAPIPDLQILGIPRRALLPLFIQPESLWNQLLQWPQSGCSPLLLIDANSSTRKDTDD